MGEDLDRPKGLPRPSHTLVLSLIFYLYPPAPPCDKRVSACMEIMQLCANFYRYPRDLDVNAAAASPKAHDMSCDAKGRMRCHEVRFAFLRTSCNFERSIRMPCGQIQNTMTQVLYRTGNCRPSQGYVWRRSLKVRWVSIPIKDSSPLQPEENTGFFK